MNSLADYDNTLSEALQQTDEGIECSNFFSGDSSPESHTASSQPSSTEPGRG